MSNETKNNLKEEYPQNLIEAIIDDNSQQLPCDFNQTLAYILAGMSEREQRVIEMYFRYNMTYMQIGKTFNVTQERIRQIKEKAIRKLRHPSRLNLLKTGIRNQIRDAYDKGRQETTNTYLKVMTNKISKIENTLKINTDNDNTKIPIKPTSIEDINLSVRSYNVLKRAGCNTLESIAKLSRNEFTKIRNLGQRSAEEILEKLHEHGLMLRDENSENSEDGEIFDT